MQPTLRQYATTVLHRSPWWASQWHRSFSSVPSRPHSEPLSPRPRPARSALLVEVLRIETQEPVWRLLAALHARTHRLGVTEALQAAGVTMDEYRQWKPFLYEPDIGRAVQTLRSAGWRVSPVIDENREEENEGKGQTDIGKNAGLPMWVILYLTAFKVRTSQQALRPLPELVYAYLDTAPLHVQGPLLILAAVHLARFGLLLPLRRVVDTFTSLPVPHSALEFNLLLQALACAPHRTAEGARVVVQVLRTMEARQLKLFPETYGALLRDRFVTLQLTKELRERMIRDGVVPTAAHLEAYLRIFAKNGAIHDAGEYHRAIISRREEVEHAPEEIGDPETAALHRRSGTLLLAAQEDHASAFGFLGRMLTVEKARIAAHVLPHQRYLKALQHRQLPGIFDATTALSVAARDPNVGAPMLTDAFRRIATNRPTAATYTVLIRGLLRRKSHLAEQVWAAFSRTGIPVDREALGAGVEALTRAGKPHEAFRLLEAHAGRKTDSPAAPHGVYRVRRPVSLTATTLNGFLVALTRIGRPDVVFKMWDHMGALYGVYPDARALSIVLQAARLAGRLDDSFAGAMAQLALKNPFRAAGSPPSASREAMVADVKGVLGDRRGGVKRYASGIWNGLPSMEAARKVFLQAIFGNAPVRLRAVVPPAYAIRDSVDADPMHGMGLPRLGPHKAPIVLPPDLLTPEGESWHPQIVVTNENCMRYILLLGSMARAGEIPLVLAWMRELKIQPTQATLAAALVFWSEVSVQAPLIEAWAGGPEKNEYSKLVEWIEEWVGEGRLPTEQLLGRWQRNIAQMRENR